MRNIKPLTLYIIYLISSVISFIAYLVVHLLATFKEGIFGAANTPILIATLILSIVAGFGVIFASISVVNQVRFLKRLKIQNMYSFGQPSTFYDLAAFKNRVFKLNRLGFYSKRKQCIIAFTAASLDVSENKYRNEDVTKLNYALSEYIGTFFETHKGYSSKRYNVFCFDRGVFLVYSFNDNEEFINTFITAMTNRVFSIIEENELKVWAQPFFGVRVTNPDDNITKAIEDALVARNNGEANFESYTVFNKEISEQEGTVRLNEIREAIINDEFVPFYQPKYNLKKKEFVSCEVLARWQSPTKGLLAPNAFIHKAEQYGLLSKIDLLVFEKSLRDLSNSIKRGRRVIPISANFSLYEFFSHSFLDTIMDLLAKYQVPATLVEIEITESTSQVNQFLSISVIKKLKDKGIRVLMDDYGVGYSQIDNFKNIPFDGIKIDKSYTDELLTDEKVRSIIKFLVELGHVNDLEVIVEGVEKKEQVDLLRKMHVDTIQGFYYSKPLPLNEFETLLKENKFEGGGK